MSFLKAGDTISGQEAVARITIKEANGASSVEDMFWAKDLDATCEILKTEVKTLGRRGTQHKPNGWTGSGSMTIFYITSIFRKMCLQYIKTGIPVYFDMLVSNDDPGSTVGAQTTLLKDCTVNSVTLAKFNVESEILDETVDFTFNDAELLDEFGRPVLGS